MKEQYLSVSAVVKYIKHKLETDDNLKRVLLRGEISNLVKHSRGHFYFSLKDEQSQIRAVMFASYTDKLAFIPKDGDKVLVEGAIDLYLPGGSFSINIWKMEPDGIGALYLAYEKLKEELSAKGYFDVVHKKPIPKYPKTIGVITSPTGAAIQDIIQTIERRYPLAKVLLYPALVQGEKAKNSISQQIKKANEDGFADVLIVGRGGGSIEDLWAFNELLVIEAIYNSKIPIISAIGHETDFTIADFVSDLRAPTPTGAAELATPNIQTIVAQVKQNSLMVLNNFKNLIAGKQKDLVYLEERLLNQNPIKKVVEAQKNYQKLNYDLKRNFEIIVGSKKTNFLSFNSRFERINLATIINQKKENFELVFKELTKQYLALINDKEVKLQLFTSSLKHLNPLNLMTQGYSITTKNNKRISSIKEIKTEDLIETRLKDGKFTAKIVNKEEIK